MKVDFAISLPKQPCPSGGGALGQGPDYFAAANDLEALMFSSIADKIEENSTVLDIPLQNIERWVSGGHPDAQRLLAWREIIMRARSSPEALAALVVRLKDSSPDSMRWKAYSPFAGVLSSSEMDALADFS